MQIKGEFETSLNEYFVILEENLFDFMWVNIDAKRKLDIRKQ